MVFILDSISPSFFASRAACLASFALYNSYYWMFKAYLSSLNLLSLSFDC